MFLKLDAKLNEMMNKLEVCVSGKKLTQANEAPIKCERGMDSSLDPRVVTSVYDNSKVLCDTKTDGGGWIIIQRRIKGDIRFNVSWDSYRDGFGSLRGDFWLGNDFISTLTRQDDYMLRIDMKCDNTFSYAVYNYFRVEDDAQLYTLRLGAYSAGNGPDRLSINKDRAFSTWDRDNDMWREMNCASNMLFNSGWWFNNCGGSNLNGVFGSNKDDFIYWDKTWPVKRCTFVEMKIRKKETATSHHVSEF